MSLLSLCSTMSSAFFPARCSLVHGLVAACAFVPGVGAEPSAFKTPLISDQVIPLQLAGFPKRPPLLVEWGRNDFFGPGPIPRGHALPTGAVWQPQFVVFGEIRSAWQMLDVPNVAGTAPGTTVNEWANRLDLFGVLYLTPTERFVAGVRPFDRTNAAGATRWFGYQDRPKAAKNWTSEVDGNLDTFFFEGDFGSIFRNLDRTDTRKTDYHFTIGRQPLVLQDGLLAAGGIDLAGVTRTSTYLLGSNSTRATALYGWGVSRNNNRLDHNTSLAGFSMAADYNKVLVEADALYAFSGDRVTGGDGFFAGVGVTTQFDVVNANLRVLTSHARNGDSAAVSTGTLLFSQLSVIQPYSENLVYLDLFWGIDQFSSAMRGPANGGPLGQAGILFAAVGMGRFAPALGNRADDSIGAGLGWQIFFDPNKRKQLVIEGGFRDSTLARNTTDARALALRYQQAFGTRLIGVLEGYYADRRFVADVQGIRTELRVKF